MAVQVLEEIGINHSGESKHADKLRQMEFDLVVTVCDSAAERCPAWLGTGTRMHFGFTDPAAETGSDNHVLGLFRSVRDEIAEEIIPMLRNHEYLSAEGCVETQ